MGKVWVLDTETKGTGAEMVPLDRVLQKPPRSARRPRAKRRAKPGAIEAPEPRQPRRFRVTDVLSRQVLVEDADAQTTLAVLRDVGSIVDVSIAVWHPTAAGWRPLTLAESKLLWRFRGEQGRH